jgi:hypothetical protein
MAVVFHILLLVGLGLFFVLVLALALKPEAPYDAQGNSRRCHKGDEKEYVLHPKPGAPELFLPPRPFLLVALAAFLSQQGKFPPFIFDPALRPCLISYNSVHTIPVFHYTSLCLDCKSYFH